MAVPSFAVHLPRRRLPLVTLYLTERCNSRCVTCDYWRHGRTDMDPACVERLIPDFKQLGTRLVVLSGGEPLLHPEWESIARVLRSNQLEVWLLTSGLSLAKHARRATSVFDAITVSLDGVDGETYAAIRGLDAFDKVCEGIRAAASHGMPPGLRVTLQRANYRQLPQFVDLAKNLGARQVSFLAVDVANVHAFGRTGVVDAATALRSEDLPELEAILRSMQQTHCEDFRSGFIAETAEKLGRIHRYFRAVHGLETYPKVRCNAPEFSAVIDAEGRVQPCFFIAGPQADGRRADFLEALDGEAMSGLRREIGAGERAECKTCVCSMWREIPA